MNSALERIATQRPAFLAFVKRRVRSGADADDLLQQALAKASEKIATLREGERAEAWFYRVLRNTIADHHVAWARRNSKIEAFAKEASEAPHEEAAVCACSLGILAALRPEYEAIIRRVDIEEEPLAEVAASLGVTANNAKVRLHRARTALREGLLAHCGTCSRHACADCRCD